MTRKMISFGIVLIMICGLFSACGGQSPADGEPSSGPDDAAAAEVSVPASAGYGTEDEPYIIDAEDKAIPSLDAACALHDGYRSTMTREEGEELLDSEPFGMGFPEMAFSDNGHAMILFAREPDMGKVYHVICFTTDYGETWKQYSRRFPISNSIEGLLTDGQDYWIYGWSHNHLDSYIARFTDHMTPVDNVRDAWLADYAQTAQPEAEHTTIESVRYDEETRRLQVEIRAYIFDKDYGNDPDDFDDIWEYQKYQYLRPISTMIMELDGDLTLRSAEVTENIPHSVG